MASEDVRKLRVAGSKIIGATWHAFLTQGCLWVDIIDHLSATFEISLRLPYFAKFLVFSFQLN